jgi:hypothetical protein
VAPPPCPDGASDDWTEIGYVGMWCGVVVVVAHLFCSFFVVVCGGVLFCCLVAQARVAAVVSVI